MPWEVVGRRLVEILEIDCFFLLVLGGLLRERL